MSRILIESKPVALGFDHIYLVYDPDNNDTNGNERVIIFNKFI